MDEKRLRHSVAVAECAMEIARILGWSDEKQRKMWLLGYVHDIGYQFVDNQVDHENEGGRILRSVGYENWREVYYHGKPSEWLSDELVVLNLADLLTSRSGEKVSLADRLSDIARRYGERSIQYQNSCQLVEVLRKEFPKRFDVKLEDIEQ